ncbi:MAG TPA: CHAT domain-containing protein [Kofleriaceae bacterium]|nr:CHAT domain-containing protein [Kofleriaceae bacterium]
MKIRRDVGDEISLDVASYERRDPAPKPRRSPRSKATGAPRRKPRARTKPDRAPAGRTVILFIASNPFGTTQLRLGEECAEIQHELKLTVHRDRVHFEARWAVSVDELMRHLTELDPDVVHFSGHGSSSAGLLLQDEHGQPQPVPGRALAMMIRAAARRVRVVVLNACSSTAQAEALRAQVDCVVGMDGAVDDDAARVFARRLYGAIGSGCSVGNAVEHGVAALAACQLPDELLPRCVTRDGVDPDCVILAGEGVLPRPAPRSR